jgi:SH3 domain-containing YSC84-like protein 1
MAAPRQSTTYHQLPAPGVVNNLKDEIQSKVMENVGNAINSFDPKSLPQHIEGALGAAGNIINSFEPKWTGQKEFSSDWVDDCPDGYEFSAEYWGSAPPKPQKPVNLKNVLGGIVAIIDRNCKRAEAQPTEDSKTSISFLGSSDNGDTFLHSSVYMPMPTAPPLLDEESLNYNIYRAVIEAEPPEWLPDSYASSCMQCAAPFTPVTRGRHHCRFCGAIFCRLCSKGRCLLPAKFRERNPQRVCDACYDRLDPVQNLLIHSVSNASQTAKHDVMDWTCSRAWLNLPIGLTMEFEVYKAANALQIYSQVPELLSLYLYSTFTSQPLKLDEF